MLKYCLLFLFKMVLLFLFFSCQPTGFSGHSTWKPIYKHDEKGNPIFGNKEELINGIRAGQSLRIGWGWKKEIGDSIVILEHVADPIFVTILQEKEVSAIINAHPLLNNYRSLNGQNFREEGDIWQCVLTTTGTFNAKLFDRQQDTLLRDWPQRHRMTWFLETSKLESNHITPLYQ